MKYPPLSILPDNPELTSDLEWMLQSGQVPIDVLAAELTRAYFQDLRHWLALVLDDPDLAVYVSLDAILAAAMHAYRLPTGISSQVWVFQQAARYARRALRTLRIQRRLGFVWRPWRQVAGYSLPATYLDATLWLTADQLPDESRLAAGLGWGLGLDMAAIAQILGMAEMEIDRMLTQATRSILDSLSTFELRIDDLPEQALDLTISESLARRSAQLQSDPVEIESLAEEIAAEAKRQSGRLFRSVRLKEFTWLGIIAALILGLFWMVTRLLPEEEPAGTAGMPGQISQAAQADLSVDQVLRLDYYARPGMTVDEIGQALGLQPAEMDQLRSAFSDSHLDFARPVRIELAAPEQFPTPTPVVPVAHRQAPLTINSSPLEISNLMKISSSLWKTLWLDAVYFDYGPDGYVGSPHQYRVQSWYSQPDTSLTITWTSGSDNTYAVLRKNGLRFTRYHQGWLDVRQDGLDLPDKGLTQEMVFPNRSLIFGRSGQMRVLGEDLVAGRPVIVVDWGTDQKAVWPNRYRMWVDAQTGIVLRFQFYSGQEGETLLGEVVFAKLDLDVNFPQPDLFTPWRLSQQVFVSDYRGEQVDASVLPAQTLTPAEARRSQTRLPPPPGFDPAASRLSFHYELSLRPSNKPSNVAVFADEYYLGDLQLSDPWSINCVRSPDGRKVAYSFNPYGGPLIGSGWFDLESPLQVMTGTFRQRYGIFAFSSDSRQLAFFGRDPLTTPGILTVIDTKTGQEHFLTYYNNVASLFWSPDGSQIAVLAATNIWWSHMDAVIVDATSGKELFRTEVDPESFWISDERGPDWPTPDWPARDWGLTFPQIEQGLSACASPP